MFEALMGKAIAPTPPKPIHVLLSPAEFITGSAFSAATGMDAQAQKGTLTAWADTTAWMIIRDDDKVFAIPQKALRYGLHINACNAVNNANVNIGGATWQCRLFTGVNNTTSEWAKYMFGLCGPTTAPYKRWANYSYDELGVGDANSSSIGVGVYIKEPFNGSQYYIRGSKNNIAILTNAANDTVFNSRGWRPILELIDGTQDWV
jgi:hypothetical protein